MSGYKVEKETLIQSAGPQVELDNVSLHIDGTTILTPVSAVLGSGEIHAIIGPNGAGKTSLLKSILGLMPHKGDISLHWQKRKTRVAYIPQQPQFDQVLPVTITDFLSAGLTNFPVFWGRKKQTQAQVSQLLSQVGLEDKAHLPLGKLSGGERQRLMFAQALGQDADLWCLDEPMTGLDTNGQQLMSQVMLNLRMQGKTLVVIHHDMQFVNDIADNVLLINAGLVAQGKPQEVLPKLVSSEGFSNTIEVAA